MLNQRVLREFRGFLDQAVAALATSATQGEPASSWGHLEAEERAFAEHLEAILPPIVGRAEVSVFIAGMEPKTLANDDSAGEGPAKRVLLGGKVYYTREEFIAYLIRKGMKVIPATSLGKAPRKPAGASSPGRRASCRGSGGRSA